MITFGGVILPYVPQQAVENYGWLTPGQTMAGLVLAETTPGPLIMVLQFVGFVGACQHPNHMEPLLAATAFFVGIQRFQLGIVPVIAAACLTGLSRS
ncbi:MAG: hypothetical protein Fur0032_03330 [Terrimicrobiaceae bacterium]